MEYLKRFLEYAPEAYDAIRDADDVAVIARNTGWAEFRIRRIKKHLFYDEHQLDYDLGFNRFSPDPDIADAWIRLQRGNFNPEDLRLLEHEYFESRFEGIFHTNYRTAHEATERSGRFWSPPVISP
ncbi:hypothetical protein ANSO36C_00730 [Nostoc cf. commune SO-36]|uniref:Uncharacterized protein n=1 Tax=Nostoc cf. commune SO-36 TaxID=449208 RepID=A0ABM7YUH0_NOSCO|nr:hypothetical protein [Nostoc commune]BDI14271.1 hypothetical protein ANSO36C_00730 [Nostoc cf. commune SO-36]